MSKANKINIDPQKLPTDYIPVIYNIGDIGDDILKHKPTPSFSSNIDYPKFSFGFHHYIHQTKDKMEITEQFKDKKKVYYVLNKFERYIDDYDSDINNVSKVYFDIDPKPKILSRAFFKLWELFFMFDLVQTNKPELITAHLAEGPGSFIQATMFYRDKFTKKGISKNDKYHAITLHPEDLLKYVPPLEESFIKYYSKEKPIRFIQHKTYPKEIARISRKKDNGDLTNPKTINHFGGNFQKNKADFVTADGGFDWKNENTQEQEAFKLILAEITTAVKIQAKGGNFVCKIFESFTSTTIKLICILKSFYDEVYVAKPLMSRESNSEKYIICKNFKYNNGKERNKKISLLDSILKDAFKQKNKNIVDIFPTFKIGNDLKTTMIKINTDISNRQLILINQMVDFIQKQNYRGDVYQQKREDQIEATKFWTNIFFPEVKDFDTYKKTIMKFANSIIDKNAAIKVQIGGVRGPRINRVKLIILEKDNGNYNIILTHNRKWDSFTTVGGKMDRKDKDLIDTLTREIKEETLNSLDIQTIINKLLYFDLVDMRTRVYVVVLNKDDFPSQEYYYNLKILGKYDLPYDWRESDGINKFKLRDLLNCINKLGVVEDFRCIDIDGVEHKIFSNISQYLNKIVEDNILEKIGLFEYNKRTLINETEDFLNGTQTVLFE